MNPNFMESNGSVYQNLHAYNYRNSTSSNSSNGKNYVCAKRYLHKDDQGNSTNLAKVWKLQSVKTLLK